MLSCGTIWAYLRDRHDQAVQNHCSNLNLATVNGFNIQKLVLTDFTVITVRFEFWILNFSIQSIVCNALSNGPTPMSQTVIFQELELRTPRNVPIFMQTPCCGTRYTIRVPHYVYSPRATVGILLQCAPGPAACFRGS